MTIRTNDSEGLSDRLHSVRRYRFSLHCSTKVTHKASSPHSTSPNFQLFEPFSSEPDLLSPKACRGRSALLGVYTWPMTACACSPPPFTSFSRTLGDWRPWFKVGCPRRPCSLFNPQVKMQDCEPLSRTAAAQPHPERTLVIPCPSKESILRTFSDESEAVPNPSAPNPAE
jgi:hypothetical protein